MRTSVVAALTLALFGFGTAAAQGKPDRIPTLMCTFDKGTGGTLDEKGNWRWTLKTTEPIGPMIFDSIDLKEGTGRMIAGGGGSDVLVRTSENVLLIVEPITSGIAQVTHIYFGLMRNGKMPVIHSRHSYLGDAVLPSQHVGFCRIQG